MCLLLAFSSFAEVVHLCWLLLLWNAPDFIEIILVEFLSGCYE